MCTERYVRLVAGTFVLTSAILAALVSPWFLLMTAFVGVNLFQSSLTEWCPLEFILKRFHVSDCAKAAGHSG